jgi:glycerophosphoryl diester phosphodiesterase
MRAIISIALLSLAAVAPPADAAIFSTLDGQKPLIWAHRGASIQSEENTLEAFRLAQAQNADGTELDLRLTADDQLAVFHDRTLDALTNVEDIFPSTRQRADGRYHVADFTMAELRTLEVDPPPDIIRNPAINPNAVGPDYVFRIPSYSEALDVVSADPGFEVLTEVKIAGDDPGERGAIIDALIAEWQARGYVDETSPVRVQSFSEPFMREMDDRLRQEGMTLETYQLSPPGIDYDSLDQDGLRQALLDDYTFVDGIAVNTCRFGEDNRCNPNALNVVAAAHGAGLSVFVWTLGIQPGLDPFDEYVPWLFDQSRPIDWPGQYLDFYKLGIDGVITDAPDIGVATRKQFIEEHAIPEPHVGWLLAPALAGLGWAARRRAR